MRRLVEFFKIQERYHKNVGRKILLRKQNGWNLSHRLRNYMCTAYTMQWVLRVKFNIRSFETPRGRVLAKLKRYEAEARLLQIFHARKISTLVWRLAWKWRERTSLCERKTQRLSAQQCCVIRRSAPRFRRVLKFVINTRVTFLGSHAGIDSMDIFDDASLSTYAVL